MANTVKRGIWFTIAVFVSPFVVFMSEEAQERLLARATIKAPDAI